jgi:hypothetical protein
VADSDPVLGDPQMQRGQFVSTLADRLVSQVDV